MIDMEFIFYVLVCFVLTVEFLLFLCTLIMMVLSIMKSFRELRSKDDRG